METEPGDRKSLLKKALLALDEMEARLAETERRRRAPIAVVGIGCRFPGGADSPEAYWRLMRSGVDAVRPAPADRWDVHAIERQVPDLKITWMGGFLDGIDQFDPAFFSISPREADNMDPQQRLVLETAWEALENGGIAPAKLSGSAVGVFLGVTTNDYAQILKAGDPANLDAYAATGGAINAAGGRLSYILGLQGPCMSVDTACSSSLVAIHLAIRSLRAGECNMALAGGVNAILTPEAFVAFARWGMMAVDGRCKTFDASADGFVRGEGCGVLALKPLADAQRDGDPIWAVLRGSAVNQDGRSSGLTVPNGLAQQRVIRAALADAGVLPAQIDYVEAHGTGTDLGDPIEVEALGAVLGEDRPADRPLVIGSVKTNLGHLESASGVAGLIKTVLALLHEEIPPNLHFQTPSPKIPWPDFAVEIPTALRPWPRREDRPRLAGVSSFGFSGTNAHIIIEEAPVVMPVETSADLVGHPALLLISARSEAALRTSAGRLAETLMSAQPPALPDIAFTLASGRTQFSHRLALTASDIPSAALDLKAFASGGQTNSLRAGTVRRGGALRIAMMFTGQGAQYIGMAQQLYASEAVFRAELDRCAALLEGQLDRPLLDVLYPKPGQVSPLDDTTYTQPALFAVEWALARLWMSWGIEPYALMGHSVGELVAACLAGVFSLEDGLMLIAARARRMGGLPGGGAMAAVFAPAAVVLPALAAFGERLSVAAYNAPDSTVVSGDAEALDALLIELARQDIQARRLTVSHAFHSARMDPILDAFEADAARVTYAAPRLHLISNVTGLEAGAETATPAYWRDHIRRPVQFMKGIETLYDLGCRAFIEIGPNPTLISLAQRCLPAAEDLAWVASLRAGQDDVHMLAGALGELFVRGAPADFAAFGMPANPRKVSLPTYPFERRRYWVEKPGESPAKTSVSKNPALAPAHFLTNRVELAEADGKDIWQGEISLERFPYLDDHRVQDVAVLPATAYLEMAFTAASQLVGSASLALSKVVNHKVLALQPGKTRLIQVVLESQPNEPKAAQFRIYSRPEDEASSSSNWILHVTGLARAIAKPENSSLNVEEIRRACKAETTGVAFYRRMAKQGNDWGPAFQGLNHVWQAPGQALGRVQTPHSITSQLAGYRIHPALADACGHALLAAEPLEPGGPSRRGAFVGGGMDEVRLYQPVRGDEFWAHASLRAMEPGNEKELIGDVRLYDDAGNLISETIGARLVYLEVDQTDETAPRPAVLDESFYLPVWQPAPIVSQSADLPAGDWLIFCDRAGVGREVARQLQAAGRRSVLVDWTKSEPSLSENGGSIRPDSPEDYRQLWEQVLPAAPAFILHLWELDAPSPENSGLPGLAVAQELGPINLLHLVQAVEAAHSSEATRLWIATRGAQPGSAAIPGFAQSLVWGFGRSLSLEHPDLWGGLVDLDPEASITVAAGHILETVANPNEDQVTYAGGQRYALRLTPTQPPALPAEPLRCRPDGTYCVTGGLGGLGLAAAEWLCQHGARHLILLSRTPLPPSSDWDALPAGSRVERQVAGVRRLQASGAAVAVAAVDVADETALRSFLVAYHQAGGPPIYGVIHTAGVAQYSSVVDTSPEELLIIQRAKVQGAWLLHELLRDAPLDFFVLYSSASSVLNSPLAAGYASANAFLDALACYRRQLSLPALSVNWGFWGEVGMVADFTAGRSTGESMVRLMPTAVALQALERCMAQNQPQIGVFSLDWQLLSRRYPTFSQFPLFSQMRRSGESEKPASKRPDASNDMELSVLVELEPTQRRARLENYLARVVASVLRLPIEQVNLSEPISLWGLDSLTALEIKNQVEKDSGVTLSYVRFLQGASVLELAVMMDEKVQAVVMQSKDRIAAPSLVERPADQPKAWPLSATQESMWFLQQLAPHNIAYNIAYVMRVRSVIDLPTLQRVLSALILRHPALRITIRSDGAERYQEIHDDVGLPIEHIRIEGQEIEQLREAANQIYRRPFDLGHGPVVRAALISRSDDDHLLMLLVHHIACDGWSMGILLNDFVELYAAEVNHTHPRLREIPATFGDFVWRQKQLLASPEGEDLWNYWHEKLRDAPAGLRLPTDFERPSNQTFNGASTSFTVPTELAGRIRELAHQENTTSYAVLLAAFAAYLYSLSGQEDILVGTPVSGRSQSHFEGLVGNLINMIVLRVHYRPEMSFRQLLIQVRQTVLEALDHQDYPFPTLVQRLSPARQPGRPPLFQVTFDYQQLGRYGDIASLWAPDGELRSMDLNGLRLESFYMPQQEGQYELGLQAAEGATELFGAFKYNSDLYLPETIQQMQADFLTLLEANVIDPSRDVLSERSQPKGVNIMNLPELLSVLRQKDIQINLDQGRLRVNAPAGALTPDLQAELVAHKTEIIELLQSFTGSERPSLPKIQASNGRGDAPLSFPQQRLWFLYQFNPQNTAYGIIGALEINGNLDTGCLEKAIFEVVRRHHALRTVFQKNDRGQPVQVVLPVTSFTLPIVDLQATPAEQREAHALEMIYQQAATPFDLSAGPLTRPYLFQLAPQRYWLLLHLHHIIADGWSMNTFLEETNALYQAYVAGRPSPLRELEIQYTDYASWQRRWYTPEMLQTRLDYWKQKLAGPLPILELPSDHPRPTTLSDHGANARDFIAPDLHHKLLQLCSRYEVTLFMLLLAAYKTLLYRYTGQTDLLVGAPVANRERSEIEPLIGLFVNTIVLRSDLSGNPSFLDLLYQVRETTLQAFAHQDTPFEMIVEAIHPERDTSHTPIFQVFFTLQNFRLLTNDLAGVEVRPVMLESRASKFDLSLTLGESPLGYIYDIEYNPDLFDADTIGRMMHHYRTILEEVCLDVVRPIGEIPLLTEAERQTFTQWNATEQEYPHDLTLPALFEAQVDRSPDGVAVYDEASQVSYAELDRLANQLAAYLRSLGVGPETRVGLCLPRTLDMVASLLAVMKAGAAYVPLDPAFPAERLAYMLEDSAAPVLLTDSSLAGHFQTEGLRVVCIDTDAEVIATHSERRFESGATPDNLAYIIYTSGSTGKPKGVQVLQRGLVNFLCSMQRQPGLEASDRLVSVTTLSFDIAGLELYLPLISGAQLIVVSSQTASDGGRLRRVLEERQATITQATPATWRLLLAAGWQGSPDFKILCGGEALPEDLSAELLKRCGSLWNLYGPTETTVWSTLDRTLPGQPITVGRPIANTQIYILDAYGQPLPIGVPGELYIGGDGVARGYLNRPELTQEKFLPDPFSQHPEARMYRTGDLARWRPDGRIEFLGRIDHQVKLRGFRIELGEIENVLTQHPAIRQAVVLAREDTPGDKRLAAYLTVHPNAAAPTVSELRAFLQTQLPEYMLPAVFTTLEAFPLTPNGKVDRRALPAPETSRPELANNFVAPRNETERMLAGIWQEALKLEQVGVDDNFFELGGHSLLVVQIHQQILLHFQTDLTIAQMFQFPTIRSLAQHLSRSTVEPASSPRQSAIDRAARSRAAIDRWKK